MSAEVCAGLQPLPLEFYQRDTFEIVPQILGKILVRRIHNKIVAGRLVEVEAYVGNDPASHAANGMTERNRVMFEAGGVAYVYFTYGMHFCFNVVTDRKDFPAALLVRAAEPVFGVEDMSSFRGMGDIRNLANGPAKLCQAMKIDRRLNGARLDGEELFIADDGFDLASDRIGSSPRVGIASATKRKWRFYLKGNQFLSRSEKPGKTR